ncbi:MAG: [citrate (pro-3S)-lyase] ligase [Treponema sp.]
MFNSVYNSKSLNDTMQYHIRKLFLHYPQEREPVIALLEAEKIRLDSNLDCTYGVFDSGDNLLATGSAYTNTLRCIAVRKDQQGEGLLPLLLSELIADRNAAGFFNLFVYTKIEAAPFFEKLGFYPIASVTETLVFMENKKAGFQKYLSALKADAHHCGRAAAVVMNANPFTKGHRFLIEQAATASDHLYLFMVSEDSSLVPFPVREKLIRENTADIEHISYCKTGDYLISSATFPSYFLKDTDDVISVHARLDAALFIKIAAALNITDRFVGDEPYSRVTAIYNRVLEEELAAHGITLHIIPRVQAAGTPISASHVRRCLQDGNWKALEALLPPASLKFFQSAEGAGVLERIRQADTVIHY